ncbi:MAG: UvrABC system protein A [Alphaproteobacteria bacterium MarineAlpha9_Bin5]|nr:MAG: UvrABC system protein A [Alphaproteobacteria bacterium MarineAlpha9_Bin5]HHZ66786.1 excinuclease ABC subunit UvrA [Alphaproteobacteria bacterium]HIA22309.1 excinuclease ABC subunit UvrA [Alphaproteobacteria bacterium]HIB18755.1 excinuclease ABC subunit UvrA [Alphaproteobacteria bacterium]
MDNEIRISGAKEHNLKNINVALPRNSLTVITGLSGSGKSSLAFDTIYAEGQRRYVESLSAYARQFLELMEKPDVESIEGLSPAIAIDQKAKSRNPRSTVGTVTEIYDYMRLLYARVGTPYSPATGLPIESQTVSQMVDGILSSPQGIRLYLLAPVIRGRKGEYRKEIAALMKRGFQRLKIDGKIYQIEETPPLDRKRKHDIEVVVDRVVVSNELSVRLADSVETALALSDGLLFTENADTGERATYSARFSCPVSGFTIDEIEPRLFSFNNPFGACPHCDGIGTINYFDPDLVIPNTDKSLRDGAIRPWANTSSQYYQQALEGIASYYKFSVNKPFKELPKKARNITLYGSGKEVVPITYDDGLRSYTTKRPFEGVIPNLDRRLKESDNSWLREELSRLQNEFECEDCSGFRLKAEALAVKIDGRHISEATSQSIAEAANWFSELEAKLSPKNQQIAARILKEINLRLGFLVDVGLDYLTLSRKSGTLSGGESQRIRLASQIGSGLTGVLYVLDEPSIGLHQRDNARLLQTLRNLRDLGNTVIVVEHDEEAIMAADHIIDMGPGAGEAGGQVVASGTPTNIIANAASLTGQYLSRKRQIPVPERRGKSNKRADKVITLIGATTNNLHGVTVKFPLGKFICVTGVSGSGKSSLVVDTLYPAAARHLNRARAHPGPYKALQGLEYIDKVVDIDQSPIGRTPRSNPATYTGCFTPIRDWFAGLPEAAARGYKPGRFSFNVKGGRCEACHGEGVIKVEMHFLPDVYVTCDNCRGARYNRETLEIAYRGHSIANILDMTVDTAAELFHAVPSIHDKLVMLQRVGLGYIKVGQPATTVSGGEAQRVKLAKELSRRATGKTIYILDEPTTGLHFEDVRNLLEVLHTLVDTGNTVVVIEHNLEVIKTADWIIDLGPEGGDGGGQVVVEGTPEVIAATCESYTGQYLARLLRPSASQRRVRKSA